MKTVGLIVEYNPFHKGHELHIKKALEVTGAHKAIVVMSGNYVQRGEPAIMPKHMRCEMALSCGASAVFELPLSVATSSGEGFAYGAVDLLNKLGCVDYLCFGSESGDIDQLTGLAHVLNEEPPSYKEALNRYLKLGNNFPASRALAIKELSPIYNFDSQLLDAPNNILGIEYLKALEKTKSEITPFTITRETAQYHDEKLGAAFSSASAIRKSMARSLLPEELYEIKSQVPWTCYALMEKHWQCSFPIFSNDFSMLMWNQLMKEDTLSICRYVDMNPQLGNRIIKHRGEFTDIDSFIDLIKTKNITRSRVARCLYHILLGITKANNPSMDNVKKHNVYDCSTSIHYGRLLGFRKQDADLLRLIKNQAQIPILTKLSQTTTLSKEALLGLEIEQAATNLYEMVTAYKYKKTFQAEQSKSMIIM